MFEKAKMFIKIQRRIKMENEYRYPTVDILETAD